MNKFKMPIREQNSNKGTFGKVLNFCGSDNYIGASYLSAISSLKVGCGLSALASTEKVISSVSAQLPEVVYFTRNQGVEKLKEFSVILIGCGLDTNNESVELFNKVITETSVETPLIIDADGLNILAKNQTSPFAKNKYSKRIITPHLLEASRLLGVSLNYILSNLEDTAKALSVKYQCITVLKTHRTVICNTDYEIFYNEHGNSALAKAGSGDVLAGIIAGLLAQKMELFEACKLGVYLHSRAGELASLDLTEYSVLASDLIKYLPHAIKEIL